MADLVKYIHPSEQVKLTCDFQDLLPTGDTNVNGLTAGSQIIATKSGGGDAKANLQATSQSGKTLTATLYNLQDGEEYKITFLGQGSTSHQRFVRTYLILARKDLTGEF